MTPADLTGVVVAAVRAAVADGELAVPVPPWAPLERSRPGLPGDYATALPLRLARAAGRSSREVAEILARRLRRLPDVAEVAVLDPGFVNFTLAPTAYAELIREIVTSGAAYGRSSWLAGERLTAARAGDLAAAGTLAEARRRVVEEVVGRLYDACGATVTWPVAGAAGSGGEWAAGPADAPAPTTGGAASEDGMADLVETIGEETLRHALCRIPAGGPVAVGPQPWARQNLDNPAYAVRYAHAHAAATLRHAADLGVGLAAVSAFEPRLLAHPRERALLGALAELPGRIAEAARRAQPYLLVRYLEELAGAYFGCHETVRVLPRGDEEPTAAHRSRLWLTAAARVVVANGLGLLGITAPDRM